MEGGDVTSGATLRVGAGPENATDCAAGGAIWEWPVGTESCEIGAVLPGEILQQLEFSGRACALDTGVAVLCAIMGQPGVQVWVGPLPWPNQQLDSAAAGPARRPMSTNTATGLKPSFTANSNATGDKTS
ncbi:MAG TPA: hypothetical protein VKB60_08335, partial [Terriglobales bacterium]|nr:hypothetical protein [Terriglobales bacterium]